jgi:hypothetical protein
LLSLPNRAGKETGFRGGLGQLQAWARQANLLTGQRAAILDDLFEKVCNSVTHPHYSLGGPSDAALMVNDMSETINRLWGHRTRGGRLYPTMVEGTRPWSSPGRPMASETMLMGPEHVASFDFPGEWTFIILLAAERDESVMGFDSRYERTSYPSELLWGPGDKASALAWLAEQETQTDECDNIDLRFAVQVTEDKIYLPRRLEVALGLSADRQHGTWHLVIADHPLDAFNQVRTGGVPAKEVFVGTWDQLLLFEHPECERVFPVQPLVVWVPGFRSIVAPNVGAD